MVRVLIGLRQTVLRHQAERSHSGWLVAGAVLGLASALGSLYLGIVGYAHPGAGADVLSLVFAVWAFGKVAQSALAGGDTTLRPELFSLLPIARRRLAVSLLVANLAEPALPFFAIAYAALIALGARSAAGLSAAAVGVVATVLLIVLTSVASTIAGGLLGAGSRRGHDLGTVVTALGLSVVAVAGTLLPSFVSTLTRRLSPGLSLTVRLLPTGWGPVAVDAAGRSDWSLTAAALTGQLLLIGVLAAVWPAVLGRRMGGAATPARPARRRRGGRRVLPPTPTGSVTGKELRLWGRDPIRLTCLLIAVVVGAAVCAIPRLTAGTTVLLPFAGLMTVVIAGACACNLYGSDGTSLWLTVLSPRSSRPDVRGRQLAWLTLVGPYAVAVTVVLTAVSGQQWSWPWVLAGLPALLGGGAGLLAYGSLLDVQPLDDGGNPTPEFSLKVHLALVAVAGTALPALAFLGLGQLRHEEWLLWCGVGVGFLTGAGAYLGLGAAAAARLGRDQVAVLGILTRAASPL